jgi:ribosome-associated protein
VTAPTVPAGPTGSLDSARLAARAAASKQGESVSILDVRELITITDYFVITSGSSDRHVKTIAEGIETSLKAAGVRPVRVEGEAGARWILLDYVDVVVHVFHAEERDYYRLETLWQDAPRVDPELESEAS